MSQVDAALFHATVYELTRLIPRGMVTTYGHLARLAGYPSHSRLVGQALKFLGPSIVAAEEANGGGGGGGAGAGAGLGAGEPGEAGEVPWFRVLSASGAISDRGDGGAGAARQAERLRQEGVEVSESGTPTKFRVNLGRYGWCESSFKRLLLVLKKATNSRPVPDAVDLEAGDDEEAHDEEHA
ncbi:hypothetical protein FA10DRAFT_276929 [Acaromyces ingoldii]|uniref:Methylated-DNA-[protein]-cysteine S-methyltransferase DNA binding domain-containing protein n=1 Tax=Acaromyces ingoldii TaxID=215250 RepID=A0A316YU65_9BASI|nr:hypothetical protein FA10DRAFT_276929 [Acaromyces ingoldii]PWN92977.1 hypothetical protein FA10DRAFT_276929 [Acaromyces ingoldii]